VVSGSGVELRLEAGRLRGRKAHGSKLERAEDSA
jgi:hypothetical protein